MELTKHKIDKEILQKANEWLTDKFDKETQSKVYELIENNPDELIEAFHKDLEFGTGGLRGIMGVGTNRMNIYTVGIATQGLCNYLKKVYPDQSTIKVAIAHDSRINSPLFARKTAEIFSANNIKVFLFDSLRPTPELSFAIRHLGCQSGVVITASHNPKEYNGYKVYWDDGGQLVSPHDKNSITEIRKISSFSDINFNVKEELIELIGVDIDSVYLEKVCALSFQNYQNKGGNDLKIVYTSIHGTGITLVPKALKLLGYKNLTIIEEQAIPDGHFPTVISPNPEEKEALDLALKKAKEIDADILLGTDPDSDRVGIAVKNKENNFVLINGNQAAAVLVYYLLEHWKLTKKLEGNEFVAKTIVTTELITKIADSYNVQCVDTLTGFKYIAELIRKYEGKRKFIGGGEESYGYLVDDFVRDKDAVISSVMLVEIAAWAKEKGASFYDILLDIYVKYGFFKEHLLSLTKKGISGVEEINKMMVYLRSNPPKILAGSNVVEIRDYQNSLATHSNGKKTPIDLPKSNVLQFVLQDGSTITARPSGTEPKIKFYFSIKNVLDKKENFTKAEHEANNRINQLINELQLN